jgi:hypothetical protein
VEDDIADEAARKIRAVMQDVAPEKELSGVPILAEAKRGEGWGDMEAL